ncbi:hypothetical protein IK110_04100 [Candidatus Saccharibacteria bacterium]|nr:hypothetical protein [Candidatus Saccharibacteria bacterium]
MENTNENETPLFGDKPKEEPVATPIFATPTAEPAPATPIMPAAKKSHTGLIVGIIIAAVALIAATVILVIVLVNNNPNSDQKTDDTSKNVKQPLKKKDVEDEPKNTDEKPEDVDDDKDEDEDEGEGEDKNEDEEKPADDNQSGFTLSIQDKSFKFSKNYVETIKSALNAGYTMEYSDTAYKSHDLTKDTLNDYLAIETKYGSTDAAIVDANGDDVLQIYGSKDYSLKGADASNKVSAAKFEKIYYHSTLPLTLPGGHKVSCYNTTKQDVVKIYGEAKESSAGIVHYHKDGLDLAFHFDSQNTVSAIFIRID